jgi:simple sugar transport system ATP-binding protein
MPPPRLQLRAITKRYASVIANAGIDLTVAPGEIHALLGENGAGKSTLVKIIYGVTQPDAGAIIWQGAEQAIASPNAARALGIGMVFQHFSLFETLTVAENIALGLRRRDSIAALTARIRDTAARYGLAVDPGRVVHHLSVGERQRVEILRCLLQNPSLLIMDEPTSVLTPQEVAALFAILRRLAAEGCSILYISHKLEEIAALCHRATVLRAGRVVASCDPRSTPACSLAEMMIGRTLPQTSRAAPTTGAPILEIDRLNLPGDDPFGTPLRQISLTLCEGEILGIAGVAGNGQRELMHALAGEHRSAGPSIRIAGQPVGHLNAAARRQLGLAVVPEERLGRGAVGELSLTENALLTGGPMAPHGLIRFTPLQTFTRDIIARFNVVAAGPDATAASLSGGNLQKFILGREIGHAPRMLIAAHPTWGVDVAAALAIQQSLINLAATGVGILLISEDLTELLQICDRIAVLHAGQLTAPMPAREATAEGLGLLMGGVADAA